MPALWIAHVTVTDEDAYATYAKLAGPAIADHGGTFLARGAGSFSSRARNARAMSSPALPRSRKRWPAITRPRIKRR